MKINYLLLIFFLLFCFKNGFAQSKNSNLKNANKKSKKEKIAVINFPEKKGFDTLIFEEQDPFIDNDNILAFYTGKNTSDFDKLIIREFGKKDTVNTDFQSMFTVVDVYEWFHVNIDNYKNLQLRIENYRTSNYPKKLEFSVIAIQVLDSLEKNILLKNGDTTKQMIHFFSKFIKQSIKNKTDSFVLTDSGIPEMNVLPINFKEIRSQIEKKNLSKDAIDLAEYNVLVNEKGKIEELKLLDEEEILDITPFVSEFQYPIVRFKGKSIRYETKLSIEIAPIENSFQKSLLNILTYNAQRDSFNHSTENYHVLIGDLFKCGKKHGIIYYKVREFFEGFGEGKFYLYEHVNNTWKQIQSFDIIGSNHVSALKDFNFDNYSDILIQVQMPFNGSGNVFYNLLIYNPKKGELELYKDFDHIEQSGFRDIKILDEPSCIQIYASGGNYGTANFQKYQWINNKLVLKQGCYLTIKDSEEVEKNGYEYQKYEVINRHRILKHEKFLGNSEEEKELFYQNVWNTDY